MTTRSPPLPSLGPSFKKGAGPEQQGVDGPSYMRPLNRSASASTAQGRAQQPSLPVRRAISTDGVVSSGPQQSDNAGNAAAQPSAPAPQPSLGRKLGRVLSVGPRLPRGRASPTGEIGCGDAVAAAVPLPEMPLQTVQATRSRNASPDAPAAQPARTSSSGQPLGGVSVSGLATLPQQRNGWTRPDNMPSVSTSGAGQAAVSGLLNAGSSPSSFGAGFGAAPIEKIRSGRLSELFDLLSSLKPGTQCIIDLCAQDFGGDIFNSSTSPARRRMGSSTASSLGGAPAWSSPRHSAQTPPRPGAFANSNPSSSGDAFGPQERGSSGTGGSGTAASNRALSPPRSPPRHAQQQHEETIWEEGEEGEPGRNPAKLTTPTATTTTTSGRPETHASADKRFHSILAATASTTTLVPRPANSHLGHPVPSISTARAGSVGGREPAWTDVGVEMLSEQGMARFSEPQAIMVPPAVDVMLCNGRLLLAPHQLFLVPHGTTLQMRGVTVLGAPAADIAAATTPSRKRALADACVRVASQRLNVLASATLPQMPQPQQGTTTANRPLSGSPKRRSAGGGANDATQQQPQSAATISGSTTSPQTAVAAAAAAVTSIIQASAASSAGGASQSAAGGGGGALRAEVSFRSVRSSRLVSNPSYALTAPPTGSGSGTRSGAGVAFSQALYFCTGSVAPADASHGGGSGANGSGAAAGPGFGEDGGIVVVPPAVMMEHALVEAEGGTVRLLECTVLPISRCQMSVCVSAGGSATLSGCTLGPCCAADSGSALQAAQCNVLGSLGCLSVLWGGRASMKGCQLLGSSTDCVEVRGEQSTLAVADCLIAHALASGVVVEAGARVALSSASVVCCGRHGVAVAGEGSSAALNRCEVADHAASAAVAREGGALELTACKLFGSQDGAGLAVEGAGSRATARKCGAAYNAGPGVRVSGGASADLSDFELYNNLLSGLMATSVATRVTAARCNAIRNDAHGLHALAGASLRASACLISLNARDGVSVEGPATRAALGGRCVVLDNREGGVTVTGAASAELEDCKLAGNQHDGLAVCGVGSRVKASRIKVSDNVAKGVGVYLGASLDMSGCSVHKNVAKCVHVSGDGSEFVARDCALDVVPPPSPGAIITLQP